MEWWRAAAALHVSACRFRWLCADGRFCPAGGRVRATAPAEATSPAGTVAGEQLAHVVALHRPIDHDIVTTEIEPAEAAQLADRLLRDGGTRLAHSARVARQVARVACLLDEPWRSVIAKAAWLHDIGYSELVVRTGFHPLDGARWLLHRGWPPEVCRLVAWHTEAVFEAAIHGLDRDLAVEFDQPPPLVAAVLSWADMTSSPTGDLCAIEDRIDDILDRYPAGSAVHAATAAARPALRAAAAEVEALLARHPVAA